MSNRVTSCSISHTSCADDIYVAKLEIVLDRQGLDSLMAFLERSGMPVSGAARTSTATKALPQGLPTLTARVAERDS